MVALACAREKAAAAEEIAELGAVAGDQPHPCADAVAVGKRAGQFYAQPVVPIAAVVAQQGGPVVDVTDKKIEVATPSSS